jgi:hypothetical protein
MPSSESDFSNATADGASQTGGDGNGLQERVVGAARDAAAGAKQQAESV